MINDHTANEPTLSFLDAWALSLGCIIGWGAFVMPGTTFLPTAGPLGTALALSLGVLFFVGIVMNFSLLIQRMSESGGSFSYVQRIFGLDHAFLCAWALGLAYLSLLWANATALAFLLRFLTPGMFEWGELYTLFGYTISLGESLVTLLFLALFGCIAAFFDRFLPLLQRFLILLLVLSLAFVLVPAFFNNGAVLVTTAPFAADRPIHWQVFGIATLVPWAFVGFESITQSADGFGFPAKKAVWLMLFALIAGALIYILLTLFSVLFVPKAWPDWQGYVANLDNLAGIMALPTFQSAQKVFGQTGLILFAIAAFSALATSLLGFFRASSRLFASMAERGLLPAWIAKRDRLGCARNAVLACLFVSFGSSFLGRSAIACVTDISSICVSLVYLQISLCAFVLAYKEGDNLHCVTGVLGAIIAGVFFLILLAPNLWGVKTLSNESYIALATWCILGFIFFHLSCWRLKYVGRSLLMRLLLLIILFVSVGMWARNVVNDALYEAEREIEHIQSLEIGKSVQLPRTAIY